MGILDFLNKNNKEKELKEYLNELLKELQELGYEGERIREFNEEGLRIIKCGLEKKEDVRILKNNISIFIGGKKRNIQMYRTRLNTAIERINGQQLKNYFVELYGNELANKQKDLEIKIEETKYKIELGHNCIEEIITLYLEYLKTFGYGDKAIDEYKNILLGINGNSINSSLEEIRNVIANAIKTNDTYARLFVQYINFFDIPAKIYYEREHSELSKDLIKEYLSRADEDKEKLVEAIDKKMFDVYSNIKSPNVKQLEKIIPYVSVQGRQQLLDLINVMGMGDKSERSKLFSEILFRIKLIEGNKEFFRGFDPKRESSNNLESGGESQQPSLDQISLNGNNSPQKMRLESILDKIPQNFKNKEFYMGVAKFFGLECIPIAEITDDMYLEAVKTHGLEIRNIPKNKITKEIAIDAIKNTDAAFEYLPSNFRNNDFYLELVKINGAIIARIPKEARTNEIILEGIKSYGYSINYIPKEKRTLDLYKTAIKTYAPALLDIPEENRTFEMYLNAIKIQPYLVKYLPDKMKSHEVYKQIVKVNGLTIEHIPDLKFEMYLDAVKTEGVALQYIPEKERTPEIYLEAAKNGGICYIPSNELTLEMCIEAVKSEGHNIFWIPPKKLTSEFIIELFKSLGIIKDGTNSYKFNSNGEPLNGPATAGNIFTK